MSSCPPPGDLPNPGIEPRDWTHVSCIAGRFFNHVSYQWSPTVHMYICVNIHTHIYVCVYKEDTYANGVYIYIYIYIHVSLGLHEVCQAPLSMAFPKQEYQSGLPFPSWGDLPLLRDQTCISCLIGIFFTAEPWGKPMCVCVCVCVCVHFITWFMYVYTHITQRLLHRLLQLCKENEKKKL